MERIEQYLNTFKGLPKSFADRQIKINRPPKDKPLNDIIQEEGAHQDQGTSHEGFWYNLHKGYSSKLKP